PDRRRDSDERELRVLRADRHLRDRPHRRGSRHALNGLMNRVSRPALRGSFLGSLLRVWNPVMRGILESPIHWPLSRWFAVLTWTGRKSGRRYSTPIAYVREGTTVWVTTGDRWWRNL